MKRTGTNQSRMFDDGADLPLFSGTPANARDGAFTPAAAAPKQASFAACPVCLDTGSAGGRPCWCVAAC
jgi:hypothetical protein